MAAVLIPLAISAAMSSAEVGLQLLTRRKEKPAPVERGRNDDIRITSSDYGAVLPRVWGKVRLAPQILYSTGIRVEKVITNEAVQSSGGGGKGGGGRTQTQQVTTYNYYTTLFLGVCANPVNAITKMWANSEVKFSLNPDPNLFYLEAEDGVLTGGASIAADAGCSSGYKVTNIGSGGKLKFNLPAPTVPSDPSSDIYTLVTVYYKSPARTAYLSVNGGTPGIYNFDASPSDVQTKIIGLDGIFPSTLEFSNPSASAPDIDRISVWFSYAGATPNNIPVSGINDPYIAYPTDDFNPHSQYNYIPKQDDEGMIDFSTPFTSDVRIYTGTETQLPDSAIVADLDTRYGAGQGQYYASAYRGISGIVLDNHLIPNGNLENFTVEVDEGTTSLITIIRDLYALKGVDESELELSALSGLTVDGLIVYQLTSPAAVITQLEDWYQFKMVEIDGWAGKAVLRGGSPVATITTDDLCERSSGDFNVEITEISEESLPREVWFNYLDPSAGLDYKNNTQKAAVFASTQANDIINLSFPLVATAEKTKAAAETYLFRAHANNKNYDFYGMPALGRYTPGDVVTLDLENASHNVEIDKVQMALTGKVHLTGVSTTEVLINDNATLAPTVADLLKDAAKFPANTQLIAFESEPVQLTDEGLGFYAGLCQKGLGKYTGGNLYAKLPSGEDYKFLNSFTTSAMIGAAQSLLPDYTGTGEDTAHSLTIYFYEDVELESVTADQLAARPTLNLIRIGGEWLQFRTASAATLPANSYYRSAWTISNLSRGKFNTAFAKAAHANGDKCVVFGAGLQFINLDAVYNNNLISLVAPGFGQTLDMATPQTLSITGKSLGGQYSPDDLTGRVDGILKPTLGVLISATNTTVTLSINNFTRNTKYRKIRISPNSDMSAASEIRQNAADFPNGLFPESFAYVKPSETPSVHRYFRVSSSINGVDYGAESDTLDVTFASSGGSGGSSGGSGSGAPAATPPTLGTLSFNTSTHVVSGTITDNGGTGTIRVLRQLGSGDFVEVANGTEAAMAAAGLSDTPTVSGTYNYKLSQDGVSGFSNVQTITVSVGSSGSGSTPPTDLEVAEAYDSYVRLVWNMGTGGATGNINIYRQDPGSSGFNSQGSVAYNGTPQFEDETFPHRGNYTYKLIQDGVAGESNSVTIYVFV